MIRLKKSKNCESCAYNWVLPECLPGWQVWVTVGQPPEGGNRSSSLRAAHEGHPREVFPAPAPAPAPTSARPSGRGAAVRNPGAAGHLHYFRCWMEFKVSLIDGGVPGDLAEANASPRGKKTASSTPSLAWPVILQDRVTAVRKQAQK